MKEYQVMPPLSGEDYSALKTDIAARGVLVPVEYDEEGGVLDGHHRLKACTELGITDWPKVVRAGFTEEEKRQHARQLNLARRHLTGEIKRALIAAQLRETPQKSNAQIAKGLGVDDKTVASVRRAAESTSEIPRLEKTVGADGRERRAPVRKEAKDRAPKSRRIHAVRDPEFQEEAEAIARDLEIERDERIALSGADDLVAENKKLTDLTASLNRRISDLVTENGQLQRKAKMWEQRARDAGWKRANV